MSDNISNVTPKQYAHIATRVLNRAIKKREQQIAATEAGNPTSKKSLAQLRHELDQMANELMERSMLKKVEQDNDEQPKTMHEVQTDQESK